LIERSELKKKQEELLDQEHTFLTKITQLNDEIKTIKIKIEKYEKNAIESMTVVKMANDVKEENIKLKNEMMNQAVLLVQTKIEEITNNIEITAIDKNNENINFPIKTKQEYNFYMNVTGFEQLESKIKYLVEINKKLTLEKSKFEFKI